MDEGLYFIDPNESVWALKPAKDAITILQEERRKDENMLLICESCGRWGGLALALAEPFENLARALRGEQVGMVDPEKVHCSKCKAPMRQVTEDDRLQIIPVDIQA